VAAIAAPASDRPDAGSARSSSNITIAAPTTASVIHPSVPAWTWVMSRLWGGSHTSIPFRIPMTIVTTKIRSAARNNIRALEANEFIRPSNRRAHPTCRTYALRAADAATSGIYGRVRSGWWRNL